MRRLSHTKVRVYTGAGRVRANCAWISQRRRTSELYCPSSDIIIIIISQQSTSTTDDTQDLAANIRRVCAVRATV